MFISYQGRKLWFDSGAKSTSVFHICAAVNPDIVKLLTLKCRLGPAGSSKHGCYGKSTSCASEKTEILTSLHMIPSLVIGSAGSSGPAFEVCQIASLCSCQHSIRLIQVREVCHRSPTDGLEKIKNEKKAAGLQSQQINCNRFQRSLYGDTYCWGETCLAGTENQSFKKTHSFMGFVDIFGHKF